MISIVVPVYNAANYLKRCLESLSGQTFGEIEIVCVDDGSTDGSAEILEDHARGERRLRIITQENRGISAARNRGIGESRGEWLMFVDADDWVDAETCETAIKAAAGHGADVALWPYMREFDNGKRSPRFLLDRDACFEGEPLRLLHRKIVGPLGEELGNPESLHSWGTVWGKLYSREAVGQTPFTDTRLIGSAEDVLFNVGVFARVAKAVYINRPMYHYRKHADSFTGGYNEKLYDRWYRLYDLMQDVIVANGLAADFHTALSNRIALGVIGLGLNECRSPRNAAGKIKAIKRIVSAPRYRRAIEALPLGCFPVHWRLFFRAAGNRKATLLYVLLRIMRLLK